MNVTNNNATSRGGLGLVGLLTVIFVVCKVAGIGEIANWSWWWVFSPVWIAWGIVAVAAAAVFLFAVIFGGLALLFDK
jgi:hypothetical protein